VFVGRQAELRELHRLYHSGKFEMAVIYGRRRVGKTALINEFLRGKQGLSFTGLETSSRENLAHFSRAVMAGQLGLEGDTPVFPSFQAALNFVHEVSQSRRTVLVIDEYPYLAESYPAFSSLLQQTIDQKFACGNLMLILCGSAMSFMEHQVLGHKSPLYGRRTAQLKIHPFAFAEAALYFPRLAPEELAVLYGVTGGVPLYLSLMREELSIEENIRQTFLRPAGYLYEEPANLLKQEVREVALYNAIIKAIATGASRNNEIATKVGIESSACTAYLKNLAELGLVQRETPIAAQSTRKTIYSLADSMFRFWYRFIPDNVALINNGMTDRAYSRIEPHIPAFMGRVFEEICKQHLWHLNKANELPLQFTDIGRWWGNDPVQRTEAEIDLLAYEDEQSALFAECKWSNEPVGAAVLESLIQRGQLFRYPRKYFYLFSKVGFTKGCRERATELGTVRLVTLQEIRESRSPTCPARIYPS